MSRSNIFYNYSINLNLQIHTPTRVQVNAAKFECIAINTDDANNPINIQNILYTSTLSFRFLSVSQLLKNSFSDTFCAGKFIIHMHYWSIVALGKEIQKSYKLGLNVDEIINQATRYLSRKEQLKSATKNYGTFWIA